MNSHYKPPLITLAWLLVATFALLLASSVRSATTGGIFIATDASGTNARPSSVTITPAVGGTNLNTAVLNATNYITLSGTTNRLTVSNDTLLLDGNPVSVTYTTTVLPYAASIALDISTNSDFWLVLSGDLTLTTPTTAGSRLLSMRIDADGSDRTITCPAGWHYMSGSTNITLFASKVGILTLKSYGSTETNIVASWISE